MSLHGIFQELAVHLFRRQLTDPKWNASFEPYWKSLPESGSLHSKEVFENPEHRELLQNEYLVRKKCLTDAGDHDERVHMYLSENRSNLWVSMTCGGAL